MSGDGIEQPLVAGVRDEPRLGVGRLLAPDPRSRRCAEAALQVREVGAIEGLLQVAMLAVVHAALVEQRLGCSALRAAWVVQQRDRRREDIRAHGGRASTRRRRRRIPFAFRARAGDAALMNGRLLELATATVAAATLVLLLATGAEGRIVGFRDVLLGVPQSALDGLRPVEVLGPERECFERRGEDLRLGDGVARSIRYCFTRGYLEAVVVEAHGVRNTEALLAWLHDAYGRGRPDDSPRSRRGRRVLWNDAGASAFYGEAGGPEIAHARIWTHTPGEAPVPPRDVAVAPGEDVPPAGTLQIQVARRVRRGLSAQISLRYRDLDPPGLVQLRLPPEVEVESTVPEARVDGPFVFWEGLEQPAAGLKVKVRVLPEAPLGAAPRVDAALLDEFGRRTEARASFRIR